MRKIRKDDEVVVICGKDKGRRGTVSSIRDGKLIIPDINVAKKHQKPNPNAGIEGGIINIEMPIDASNVMLVNKQTDKADRVGFKFLEDGKKVRYFKSNDELVDA